MWWIGGISGALWVFGFAAAVRFGKIYQLTGQSDDALLRLALAALLLGGAGTLFVAQRLLVR